MPNPEQVAELEAMLDDLARARALIEDPAHWTKLASARTPDGYPCRAFYEAAVCFCALGAIERATGVQFPERPAAAVYLVRALPTLPAPFDSVSSFNDAEATTHADILALYDRATVLAGQDLGEALADAS